MMCSSALRKLSVLDTLGKRIILLIVAVLVTIACVFVFAIRSSFNDLCHVPRASGCFRIRLLICIGLGLGVIVFPRFHLCSIVLVCLTENLNKENTIDLVDKCPSPTTPTL